MKDSPGLEASKHAPGNSDKAPEVPKNPPKTPNVSLTLLSLLLNAH